MIAHECGPMHTVTVAFQGTSSIPSGILIPAKYQQAPLTSVGALTKWQPLGEEGAKPGD